jgi:hypothetical protein
MMTSSGRSRKTRKCSPDLTEPQIIGVIYENRATSGYARYYSGSLRSG